MSLSVCIATYRRPESLFDLLSDLAVQELAPSEIIVVDNDAGASAQAAVQRRIELGMPCPVIYDVQPVQNISLTRNRTVELARGEWLAFVDDDERAPREWLARLFTAALRYGADGIQGPVVPLIPPGAPAWIRRGDFYSWPRSATGAVVPRNLLRFGNVLLRGSSVRSFPAPFDPAYGLTGGEDGDLMARLVNGGARIVWCDEAVVHEPVVASRLTLRWLMRRALRGGQDFARHHLAGRYGPTTTATRLRFALRALAQALTATFFTCIAVFAGRHAAAYWLLKGAANVGKLTVFFGLHYREYAAVLPPTSVRDAST